MADAEEIDDTPSTSRGRKRGRPAKNVNTKKPVHPPESDSEAETDFTEESEDSNTEEESDDDMELTDEMEQPIRPKRNTLNSTSMRGQDRTKVSNPHQELEDQRTAEELEDLNFFIRCLPCANAALPALVNRSQGSTLDILPAIANASGGFKLFVKAIPDKSLVEIFKYIDAKFEFQNNTDATIQSAQCLRHMWNCLPALARYNWEMMARKNIKKEFQNKKADRENGIGEPENGEMDEYPAMPSSEIPFRGNTGNDNSILLSCCPNSQPLKNFNDLKRHFLQKHYTAIFYACHFCNAIYEHKKSLISHSCEEFTDYLRAEMIACAHAFKDIMKNAYLFLTCYECVFWLPLLNYQGERRDQVWNFLATFNKHHCGKSLALVVIYTMGELKPSTNQMNSFSLKIVTNIAKNIPIGCAECVINRFQNQEEINRHMMEHTEFKCNKDSCAEYRFGTEAHLRRHMISHINHFTRFLFSRYLKDTATVYPPVHVKDAIPAVGFANNGPAFGGASFNDDENAFEFIDHNQPLIDEKVLNAGNCDQKALKKKNKKIDKENTKGYGSATRFDLGLEHEETYAPPTEEQTNAINFLNHVFGKQMTGNQNISWNASILEDAMNFVTENKDGEIIEPVEISFSNSSESSLCKDLINFFSTVVALPVRSSVEVTSDGFLHHNYDFCKRCKTIYQVDGDFIHNCNPDEIVALHRWEKHGNRVHCHICKRTTCSIYSLKAHFIMEHNFVVELHPTTDTRSKNTIKERAIKLNWKGGRSHVVIRTDNDLFMKEFGGKLKRKSPGAEQKTPTPAPRIRQAFPMSSKRIQKANRRVLINPYTMNEANPVPYSCVFCDFNPTSAKESKDHLRLVHANICQKCGNAFGHKESADNHVCAGKFNKISLSYVFGTCDICNLQENIPLLYNHIFSFHMNILCYGKDDDMVYSQESDKPFLRDVELFRSVTRLKRPKTLSRNIPNACPEHNQLFINSARACYLCGVDFQTMELLKEHLERHEEKWQICPFCPKVALRDHEDFRMHLLNSHYSIEDDGLICKCCKKTTSHGNISHLLYECTKNRKCVFCLDVVYECATLEEMSRHCTFNHRRIFRRFNCSNCNTCFSSNITAKQHKCNMQGRLCICGERCIGKAAFASHFYQKHYDRINDSCKICQHKINKATEHRNQHLRVTSDENIVKLDRELFPLLKINVVRQSLSQKEDKEPIPSPPAFQEDIMATVDSTVQQLIDDICLRIDEEELSQSEEEIGQPEEELGQPEEELGQPGEERDQPEKEVGQPEEEFNQPEEEIGQPEEELGQPEEELGQPEEAPEMDANIQEEEDDDVQIIDNHPGYINKEVMNTASPDLANSNQPIVRTFEPAEDEDLSVVGEIIYASSSAAHVFPTRPKNFKCDRCSCSFITKKSLDDHAKKYHKHDAGREAHLSQIYGAPVHGTHYICRFCTTLYETRDQYLAHIIVHGLHTGINCANCSAAAYNIAMAEQHFNNHKKTGKDSLTFACGTCNISFRTDLRLYSHMEIQHNILLKFFCKACSMTNSKYSTVIEHIIQSTDCKRKFNGSNLTYDQMMGVFPATMVHYYPQNEKDLKNMIENDRISMVNPSVCSHRSMIITADSTITCTDCHCAMAAISFHATENAKPGGKDRNKVFTDDPSYANPWQMQLDELKSLELANLQSTSQEIPVQVTSTPVANGAQQPMSAPFPVIPPITPNGVNMLNGMHQTLNGVNMLNGLNMPQGVIQMPNGGIQGLPNEGNRISNVMIRQAVRRSRGRGRRGRTNLPRDMNVEGIRANIPGIRVVQLQKGSPVFIQPTVSSSNMPSTSREPFQSTSRDLPAIPPPKSAPVAATSTPISPAVSDKKKKFCDVCKCNLPNLKEERVHKLHRNNQGWCCLDCGISFSDDKDYVAHFYNCEQGKDAEANEERRKAIAAPDYIPVFYSLFCPIDACSRSQMAETKNAFESIELYRMHLLTHPNELPYVASCGIPFKTVNAKEKHEANHPFYERLGLNANCCPLCGVGIQWNGVSNVDGKAIPISHLNSHGFLMQSMCRTCCKYFPNDYNLHKVIRHFEENHIAHIDDKEFKCLTCSIPLPRSELRGHLLNRHIVKGFNARTNENHQHVIKSGAITRGIMGLPHLDYDEQSYG